MWMWKIRRTIRKVRISLDWSPFWFFCAALCGALVIGSLNYSGDNLLVMVASMVSSLVAAALCVSVGISARYNYLIRQRKLQEKEDKFRAKHAARLKRFHEEMQALRQ